MLAWKIALRYLFSKKSHSAINIISAITVAAMAIATAAIVVVMSVFNGFQRLAADRLSVVDPDLKAVPATGKTLAAADSLALSLTALPQVAAASPVIEERALLSIADRQIPVHIKGIPASYEAVPMLDSVVLEGALMPQAYGYPGLLLSVGAANALEALPGSLAKAYVPRRVGRINPANPQTAFRQEELIATGVFRVNQPEYDADYAYLPIESARDLLDYTDGEATAIELRLVPGASPAKAAKAVAAEMQRLGIEANVLTRAQQEEASFRMINIEKWVTFMMLAFILAIASFNIISTLSLLAIEKRNNMLTLRAMGASRQMAAAIFTRLAWLVSMAGGLVGIALGSALALAQQLGHIIKLSGDPSMLSISYYPVQLQAADLPAALGLVAAVALIAGLCTRFFAPKDSLAAD